MTSDEAKNLVLTEFPEAVCLWWGKQLNRDQYVVFLTDHSYEKVFSKAYSEDDAWIKAAGRLLEPDNKLHQPYYL